MTREELTNLASNIADQIEDATKGQDFPELGVAQFGVLELVAMLLWPALGARLILKDFDADDHQLEEYDPKKRRGNN